MRTNDGHFFLLARSSGSSQEARQMLTECAYCKKPISRKPSSILRSHSVYCSIDCANAAKRAGKTVICVWCGHSFYKARSDLTQNNLCSAKCRNAWLGYRNTTIMNVKGHTAGHKAPHLTALNEAQPVLPHYGESRTDTVICLSTDCGKHAASTASAR